MTEYINREELQKAISRKKCIVAKIRYTEGFNDAIMRVKSIVSTFKAADVAPVIHGKWKYFKKQGIAVCTNCSFERNLDSDFGRAISCPNCGAKMDEE